MSVMKQQNYRYSILEILFVIYVCLASVSCTQRECIEKPALIPIELLFSHPEAATPMISPDGSMVAYLAPFNGASNIWVKTIGKNDAKVITEDFNSDIQPYYHDFYQIKSTMMWMPDNKYIIFRQDQDGNENWHIYRVPVSGGEPVDLTGTEFAGYRLISMNSKFSDDILIGIFSEIHRLNVPSGDISLEYKSSVRSFDWVLDNEFEIRIELVLSSQEFCWYHRQDSLGEWEPLMEWGVDDLSNQKALGFSEDNKVFYYLSSIDSKTRELRSWDSETGQKKTIASDPEYDVDDVLFNPITHRPQAVRFTNEQYGWRVIDDSFRKHVRALKRLHPGLPNFINRDLKDKHWVVGYINDNRPPVYYLYNATWKTGRKLFEAIPDLRDISLAEMKPVLIEARDGLKIPCFLSLPIGVKPEKIPAVVMVHGGPHMRFDWKYYPDVQWLTNRGYAVLQVNFRGSNGYGKEYMTAGFREWGGRMQDDVTDATHWLTDKGIADPERIAIYGGSYGGFSVLSGLMKEPDLYACGVDIFGVSDLISRLDQLNSRWMISSELIGNLEWDADMLKERSPLHHTDKIKSPLFIVHGANDPRVPISNSIQLRDSLLVTGKNVEYLEFPDEGHGFRKEKNRIEFYSKAEKFLQRWMSEVEEDTSARVQNKN